MSLPATLGELKRQGYRVRPVKDELRANLIETPRGRAHRPRIAGYEETAVPRLTRAVLAHLI